MGILTGITGWGRSAGRGRGVGLAALLVLAVVGGAWAQGTPVTPASPQPDATAIVPGQAIGKWSLDMTFADLIWNLGVRTVLLTPPGPQYRTELEYTAWSDPPVVAIHGFADNTVYALGIADAAYTTREHVGVGVREDVVRGTYGPSPGVVQPPARPRMLVYNDRGLAFQIAFNPASGGYGPVERVFVFRPGQGGAIWRAP